MRSPPLLFALSIVLPAIAPACSRRPPPSGEPSVVTLPQADTPADAGPAGMGAVPCTSAEGPRCLRFDTPEAAFAWVLAKEPLVLGVGESHAPKGSEGIASSTKRFTETFLPLLAPRATDVVVELWAPDPSCKKPVQQVASAQRPVTDLQAPTNQNEYVTLGTKAKEAGMTPWLLRPTCDDFAALADAGDGALDAMLGLVKRLTAAKLTQLHERNARERGADAPVKMVVAYGGALHNDLAPTDALADYSFGPELDRLTGGRYVELDVIVPEFVKKTPAWEKLPWFAAFEADRAGHERATLYVLGERSFTLVLPSTPAPR